MSSPATMPRKPQNLFDRLWDMHAILTRPDGASLLEIDRHFVHEGSHHAFAKAREKGRGLAAPERTFGIADHYVPTRDRAAGIADPTIRRMVETLQANCAREKVQLFGLEDPRQGIVHVVGPEQGLSLPGLTIVCGDSHTATHGALGAFAFGIGASEVAHVLMTQTLWQKRPKSMRIHVSGDLAPGIGGKDLALTIIAKLGADGARGHVIEYAGPAIAALSIEGRLSLCNLSIESGARAGLIAPDEATFRYLEHRPFAPKGAAFAAAVEEWRQLRSDDGASFDGELSLEAGEIAPLVTWGTSPEEALPISARVPDPAMAPDAARAAQWAASLDYMALKPGMPLSQIPIDRVFIGSCTNSRIEDLRAAAAILAGRRAKVPGLVSPGSSLVKARAEQEGLAAIFTNAGLEWGESGCSMCVGMNGDLVAPGERCASTTNRNFRGRQGPGARTHLMSPAMVAAAAIAGHLTDMRPLLAGRG